MAPAFSTPKRIAVLILITTGVTSMAVVGQSKSKAESELEGWVGKAKFEEIPDLKMLAMQGDSTAALKLANYYMKFPDDVDTFDYWSQIAAENGSASGQWNYSVMLDSQANSLSKARARFWVERAAEQGQPTARNHLKKLEEHERRGLP